MFFVVALMVMLCNTEEKLIHKSEIVEMHRIGSEKREKNKRKVLVLDEECCRMAQEWADHMKKVGKRYHGKNDQIIATGYKDTPTAFSAWMNSCGHRYWLLNSKSTKCGWGYQVSEKGTKYWVGVFR